MAFYNGNHAFDMETGIFNNFTTHNTTTFEHPAIDPAPDILDKARAVEATHTSNTATYAPKCKPGTRTQIIGDMMEWGTTSILWFSGPAGGGKPCIMREVVDQCEKAGFLAASYFFSTRVPGLYNERPFVATLAHHLSLANPATRASILKTISARPSIFYESLDLQLEKLVIEPLLSDGPSLSSRRTIVIAVDGFDECHDLRERKHLFELFISLVEKLSPYLIILIASRPEYDIRTASHRSSPSHAPFDSRTMMEPRIFATSAVMNLRRYARPIQ